MNNNKLLSYIIETHPKLYKDLVASFKEDEIIVKWLNTPKPMLDDNSPISLLETEPEQVIDFLYKIKTGDLS